jgi:hypothetical protein
MPTATFIHGLKTVIYLGVLNLTNWFDGVDVNQKADIADTSTFGSAAHTFIAGLKDGDVALSGLFDGQANAVDAQLSAILGVSTVCTVGLGGDTQPDGSTHLVTAPAKILNGLETDYKVGAKIGSAVVVTATMRVSGGVDNGAFLLSGAASNSATFNANYLDNGGATTNGFSANLHQIAVTGAPTTVTWRVTDSADHVTFAAIASPCTFANSAAGPTVQQVTGTGTVRQYIRAELQTLSGGASPTVTAAIAFARR